MPRKDPPPACEQLLAPHVIDPNAVYEMPHARAALRLAKGTLSREIKLGRLRSAKRAGKVLILGAWLLEWIAGGEVRRGTPPGLNGRNGAG
jgi:hypothetical protein